MDQQRIYGLLDEAARHQCSSDRLGEIQSELADAVPQPGGYNPDSPYGVMRHVVEQIFNETARVDPRLLPGQFATFAALCGDRVNSDDYTATIDWRAEG